MATFRSSPETFRVHEVPAYDPSGTGEHIYVFVEKRGLTTPEAIRMLATAVDVDPRDVGYAGMKDKHATTTQWLSFPQSAAARLAEVLLPDLRVVEQSRHANKLRVGHVRKNLFEVTLTEVTEEQREDLVARFAQMVAHGIPNRYGQQRFGHGDNVASGLAILNGKLRMNDRRKRTLLISSVQSAVFNLVLQRRVDELTLQKVMAGDVLAKSMTGGLFTSTDEALDQVRLQAGEIVTTGPLPGMKAPRPAAGTPAADLEVWAMDQVGLTEELMAKNARDLPGARRPLVMKVEECQPALASEDRLKLSFALPSGAYATVVVDALLASSEQKHA